jgi:flagellar biosynthesis protein FlhF
MNFMFEKLTQSGVDSEIAAEVLNFAQQKLTLAQAKKKPMLEAFTAKWLLDHTFICENPYPRGIHLYLGARGSGKTSALIKMATNLVIKKKASVAILTTDTYKVGAADQLRIFCKILNVPFAIIRSKDDWDYVSRELANTDYLLCDMPGLDLSEIYDIDLLKKLLPPQSEHVTKHLILSATAKDKDCLQIANRYRMARFSDVIFTNLDQSSQHGVIFNFQYKIKMPLHSFSMGSRIPEDFELATKERVLDLLFKLSKIRSGSDEE